MSNVAIRVEGIGKRYRIGTKQEHYQTFRDTISNAFMAPFYKTAKFLRGKVSQNRNQTEDIWAVQDISFEVGIGEVVGIIGRNGAGKSTLLKILSRITEPTTGHVDIYGRVGALLEVGTGFHPELTGRENIFLNGAILGMKRLEIARNFDEIVAFAEVEKFIDTPVKHYSSGMGLRLGFSVAAHLEPEILVVDEVLAVGDFSFQQKCLGKMQDVGKSGRTVLFVSHNMAAISGLTDWALVLDKGAIHFVGPTDDAINQYTSIQKTKIRELKERSDRTGDGVIRLDSIQLHDSWGNTINHIGAGENLNITINYSSEIQSLHSEDIMLDVHFTDSLGQRITTFSTRFSKQERSVLLGHKGSLICHIPSLSLAEETYTIDLWLAYRAGLSDSILGATEIYVCDTDYYGTGQSPVKRKHGAALIKHKWQF